MIGLTVYGIPQTKGSAKAFIPKGWDRAIITNDNAKNKAWAAVVSAAAQQARQPDCPWDGPIRLTLKFYLPIPKSLSKRDVSYMTKKPDLDKMIRSIKDALKGVLYLDDRQVVGIEAIKLYSPTPGAYIYVRKVTEEFPYGYIPNPDRGDSVHREK